MNLEGEGNLEVTGDSLPPTADAKRVKCYRIQDCVGRGPFRPGFSKLWADEDFAPGMVPMPTWMEEFGIDACTRLGQPGESFGSAVRSPAEIGKWFSYSERNRLRKFGFHLVEISGARIMAESEHQLLIATSKALKACSKVLPWSYIDRSPLETRSVGEVSEPSQ